MMEWVDGNDDDDDDGGSPAYHDILGDTEVYSRTGWSIGRSAIVL